MISTSQKRLRTTAWMNKKTYKTDKISHQNTAVFYMAVFLCYTKIKKEYSKKCAWNGGIDRIIMVQCNERKRKMETDFMLNEDKIKLMTSIALFEKREGKHIFPANRYFRSDYISGRILRSFFAYTLCFILCTMIWVLCAMEQLLNVMELNEIVDAAKRGTFFYVAGLILYLIITGIVSSRRYEYARRGMRVYVAKLKRLDKRYDFQNRTKELTKEGSRHDDISRA